MIKLSLDAKKEEPLNVLCLGAHSDDIEIGCGGSILRLIDECPQVNFHWVVFSARGDRRLEAEHAAELFAGRQRLASIVVKEFPDGFLPYMGAEVKAAFEGIKETVSPDLIFTHQRDDAHQDHRLLCELTWNTFRNHFILEYEIPKYDDEISDGPPFFSRWKFPVPNQDPSSDGSVRIAAEQTLVSRIHLRGPHAPPRHGMQCTQRTRRSILLQKSSALK